MKTYENFARVYDELMDNVPYEEWAQFLSERLSAYGISGGLMLDLACGTGKMTALMAERGFDMIGVDSSVDMLQIARERAAEGCLYLLQDMREFELYGTVGAVISVCDSINYVTEEEERVQEESADRRRRAHHLSQIPRLVNVHFVCHASLSSSYFSPSFF